MTAGRKHLKLIKRFYGTHIEGGSQPSSIMFHTPTSPTPFTIVRGRYVCFIDGSAYLIDLDRDEWEFAVEKNGAAYVNYKDKGTFIEGLLIINYAFTSVSYINRLNDLQKFDYYGLLRTKYINLEETTTGLYLIKN